jgi:hypothetical protein
MLDMLPGGHRIENLAAPRILGWLELILATRRLCFGPAGERRAGYEIHSVLVTWPLGMTDGDNVWEWKRKPF